MKKVILMAVCLFTITTVSNAQEVQTATHPKGSSKQEKGMTKLTPEQRAQKNVDNLNSSLTLTEDQKPKVYDLALTRIKNIDAVKEKYKGQEDKKETAKAEIQVIRKTYRQGVKALLTPDQLAKVKAAKDAKGKKEGGNEDPLEGKD